MFLNSMPIYVNKHCLQIQIVDYVNWILKDNFTANWMSTGFGIKDRLSPESDSLSITLNSSPFSLSLCLQHFIAYELQTQCLQGAIILQCRRLRCLGMGWIGCKWSIWNSILCLFTWVCVLKFKLLRWEAALANDK